MDKLRFGLVGCGNRATRKARRPRVLLVGPLPQTGIVVGGANVLFAETVRQLKQSSRLETRVVSTSRRATEARWYRRLLFEAWALARVLGGMITKRWGCDLILYNSSAWSSMKTGPIIWFLSRALRLPLVIRFIGGSLDLIHEQASAGQRWLAERSWLRSQLILLETQALCTHFKNRKNIRWFPNLRCPGPVEHDPDHRCRRFLFLSQLRPEKGFREAVLASEELPEGCALHVYGPVMPTTDLSIFKGHNRAEYHGPVSSDKVPDLLRRHDVLVLPTRYVGEGHPGVIIEALQAGLPVIATRWRSLGEVVVHGSSGLLVEPGSVEELSEAMRRLVDDQAYFNELRTGAAERGAFFDSNRWHEHMMDWLHEIAFMGDNQL